MSETKDLENITDLADRYAPTMLGRVERAAATLRNGVDLDRLTLALADGDVDKALRAVVPATRLHDSTKSVDKMMKETLIPKGGRLGARILNDL